MQFLQRNKKLIFLLLKILALIFAIYVIKRKLFDGGHFDSKLNFQELVNGRNIKILIIIIFLMPLNWFLEAIKWKYLVFQTENISVAESFKAILKGVYLSLITPNRIGEGLGKIDGLKRKSRSRGAYAFFVGSMAQLLVTSVMGVAALWLTKKSYIYDQDLWLAIKVLVLIITFLMLISFYYEKWRASFARLISLVFRSNSEIKYTPHQLNNVLTLSLMRYCIFAIQFYLALTIFEFNLSIVLCFLAIAITYLFSTWIPSFLMGDLGVREGVAIVVFGMFMNSDLEIVFIASLIVWVVNLLIPAIAGMFLFTFKKRGTN